MCADLWKNLGVACCKETGMRFVIWLPTWGYESYQNMKFIMSSISHTIIICYKQIIIDLIGCCPQILSDHITGELLTLFLFCYQHTSILPWPTMRRLPHKHQPICWKIISRGCLRCSVQVFAGMRNKCKFCVQDWLKNLHFPKPCA